MEYLQEITLDLNSNTAPIVKGAKQYDNNSRKILVHLTKDNVEYIVPRTHTAAIRITKPDQHVIYNSAEIQADGSILVTLNYQCLVCAGYAYADIAEYDSDGNVLSTVIFTLQIEPSPNVTGKAVISSDEFEYLTNFYSQADQIIEESSELLDSTTFDVDASTGILSVTYTK